MTKKKSSTPKEKPKISIQKKEKDVKDPTIDAIKIKAKKVKTAWNKLTNAWEEWKTSASQEQIFQQPIFSKNSSYFSDIEGETIDVQFVFYDYEKDGVSKFTSDDAIVQCSEDELRKPLVPNVKELCLILPSEDGSRQELNLKKDALLTYEDLFRGISKAVVGMDFSDHCYYEGFYLAGTDDVKLTLNTGS
jgi:hypothetical protein